MSSSKVLTASLLAFGISGTAAPSLAQTQGYESFRRQAGQALTSPPQAEAAAPRSVSSTDFYFRNRADSLNWVKNKKVADNSNGFRIIVSLQERRL